MSFPSIEFSSRLCQKSIPFILNNSICLSTTVSVMNLLLMFYIFDFEWCKLFWKLSDLLCSFGGRGGGRNFPRGAPGGGRGGMKGGKKVIIEPHRYEGAQKFRRSLNGSQIF